MSSVLASMVGPNSFLLLRLHVRTRALFLFIDFPFFQYSHVISYSHFVFAYFHFLISVLCFLLIKTHASSTLSFSDISLPYSQRSDQKKNQPENARNKPRGRP